MDSIELAKRAKGKDERYEGWEDEKGSCRS